MVISNAVIPPVALVIDDSDSDRRSLTEIAEQSGFEVFEARDLGEGLEALQEHRPDLIVVDVHLGPQSGFTLLAEIREVHPLVPVVVVTSSRDSGLLEQALNLGASNFVRKPIDAGEYQFILDRIRRAVEEEASLHQVLDVVCERQTQISIPGDPTVVARIVAYLGREVGHHYPGYVVPLADIKLALYEALANAVEHGNLEISFAEKSAAMTQPGGLEKLLAERRSHPRLGARMVHIVVIYGPDVVEYRILDEGPGFDPDKYTGPQALSDSTALHGRGLALIRHYMDEVSWNDDGTEIRMVKTVRPHSRSRGERVSAG